VDAARGRLFAKLIRQVEVAAREGGGDLESNATLRTMFQKARDASVPTDTIERAIKRGTGELEGVRYEPVTYEGYAPCGVAVFVECLTDNRNRTGAEVRSIFSKNGGSTAEPGAVAWQFQRKGVVIVPKSGQEEDEVMLVALEAGAEDLNDSGDTWTITTAPADLAKVRTALDEAGVAVESAELTLVPTTTIALESEADARRVLRLIDLLEEHDDVQAVHANFDIPDSVLQAVEA
jgi:YebC/PmpR family DNA-binding regulatory protein